MKFQLLIFSFLCVVTAEAQTPFRFAWLTDTHVGSLTGEEDLRRSVKDINTLREIAFVIVSGDITEMGATKELLLAKHILDSLRIPYYSIPGNHDTNWSESGCTMFSRLWRDDKFVFEYGGVRFIACSSGPNMRMGDGHVPEEDMRWLDSVFTHMPDKDQPVVFINHYPLDDQLDNWFDVLAAIKRVNTVAVLCGHGHADHAYSFEGVPGIMARSNLRAGSAFGGYTLVDVRGDSLIFTERVLSGGSAGNEHPWAAIATIRHQYDSDTARYQRPDYTMNSTYPGVRVQWQTRTGCTIGTSPAVTGGAVIAGNNKGAIEAYSLLNGKKLWSHGAGGSVYSSPAIGRLADASARAAGRSGRLPSRRDSIVCVVAGSSNGAIVCLNVKDGSLLWNHPTNGPVVGSPLIADGIVYCGSSDGVFRALSLSTGETVWEYPGVAGFVACTPLLYEGKIIFGAWDTYLYALDSRSGALVWKWSNGSPVRNLSPATCTPVGVGGTVFIVAPDRFMTAINASTGSTIWRSNAHKVRETIGLSEDSTTVYVRTMNDTLFAFASSSSAPTVRWALDCRYGYDIAPSSPVEKNGSIFFGTKNGLVYCIDAAAHDIARCHKIGNAVINTVRPLSSTDVVVTSMDGSIARLHFLPDHTQRKPHQR